MTSNKLPNLNALSKIAEEIYSNIPAEVLSDNNGCFIAIELDSKEYFLGKTKDDAVKLAKQKYPNKIVFIRRVGNVEKIQQLSRRSTFKLKQSPLKYAGVL